MKASTDITVVCRTHPGKRKGENEDTLLVRPDIGLFIVADGMGGHQFGARASRLAVETIRQHVEENRQTMGNAGQHTSILQKQILQKQILMDAFKSAHQAIVDFGRKNVGNAIIGTTCTALWATDNTRVICHIGDSVLFTYTDGMLSKMTRDHSMVQEMVDIGRLTPEEAAASPYANILARALGVEKKNEPDMADVQADGISFILMCSDGLSKLVAVDELANIIKTHAGSAGSASMDRAADTMLDLALERGGTDNISLILIRPD